MQTVLAIHIASGALSVLTGAAALASRKGGTAHRALGTVYFASMMILGATIAFVGKDFGNIFPAGLTIYLVLTGWVSARRGDNESGAFEVAAFGVAIVCAIGMALSMAYIASGGREADNPYVVRVGYTISAAMALAALGDLSVVLRRGVSGAQRIARHLWRMCFGLVIAVGSFAAIGSKALPPAVPSVPLVFGSMGVVLILMVYWLARVLFTRWLSHNSARLRRGGGD